MSLGLYFMRIKCLLRNKEGIFWCYIFPVILSTCLYLGVSRLGVVEEFKTIKIAYVVGEFQTELGQAAGTAVGQETQASVSYELGDAVSHKAYGDELLSVMKAAKLSEDKYMFDITLCSGKEAAALLEKGDINAYIIGGDRPELFIKQNGLNETIVKSFLDGYMQKQIAIKNILASNPEALNNGLIDDLIGQTDFVDISDKHRKPDNVIIYFYAILAYTCIFATNWGLEEVVNIEADQSMRGARISASPVNKMRLFVCNMLASYTCHIISVILLLLYMKFVLNVKFGDELAYLIAICFAGSLTGLLMGANIGFWIKKKPVIKEAIIIAFTLGCSFLSGMMAVEVKYYVTEKFPLLAYINPVNLITDAMYSLYYFDSHNRYYLNLLLLMLMAAAFTLASYFGIRRRNHDSI